MKKYTLITSILISLFFLTGILFSQISEAEVRSDIQELWSADDYLYRALSQEYKLLEQKIKDNPDPYIDVIEQDLFLPTDINILCERDSISDYIGYIGLLFFLDNERAKNILKEEYDKQVSLLKSLRKQVEYFENNEIYDDNYDITDSAYITIMDLQIDFIRHCLGYNYKSFITDCLSRIDSVSLSLQANMVEYFIAVAPEDPQVALKIREMYTTPGSIIYNSDFYFEQYGYQYSDEPGTILEQMIEYIEKAFNIGDIDNKGIANSLTKKLEHTQKQLNKGKTKQAINQLNAFLHQVTAQEGKHLSKEAHDLLKYNAAYLIEKLEE